MEETIKALILGDVVGQSGCRALFIGLKGLIKKHKADVVVVNAENADGGFGITREIAERLYESGVDVITSGNHIWQKKEIYPFLETETRILRPANYPKGVVGNMGSLVPGKGVCEIERRGRTVCVINLMGREKLKSIDCPFKCVDSLLKKTNAKIVLVDFHAECTEEKEALGLFLDGRVSVVVGTHTHVQTADEKILPGGTAYITDIGMTGPTPSVIGMRIDMAIERAFSQMPIKMEVSDNPGVISGVAVEIDASTGRSIAIERIYERSIV